MSALKQYEKKPNQEPAIAIKMDLDMEPLRYVKWGDVQTGKPGDWLVCRDGEVYTIDAESFARTYSQVGPGQYIKTARIWAERIYEAGFIETKEGLTEYEAGDYLVYNEADRQDGYAVSYDDFHAMYEPCD